MVLVGASPGCFLFWLLTKAESVHDFSPFQLTSMVMLSFSVLMIGMLIGFAIGILLLILKEMTTPPMP